MGVQEEGMGVEEEFVEKQTWKNFFLILQKGPISFVNIGPACKAREFN